MGQLVNHFVQGSAETDGLALISRRVIVTVWSGLYLCDIYREAGSVFRVQSYNKRAYVVILICFVHELAEPLRQNHDMLAVDINSGDAFYAQTLLKQFGVLAIGFYGSHLF